MNSGNDAIRLFAKELALAFAPLEQALTNEDTLIDFLHDLGWDFGSAPTPVQQLRSTVQDLMRTLEASTTSNVLPELLEKLPQLIQEINGLAAVTPAEFPVPDATAFAAEFPTQLLKHIIAKYLLDIRPIIGGILKLASVIIVEDVPAKGTRLPFQRNTVEWKNLLDLLNDPLQTIGGMYRWGQPGFNLLQLREDLTAITRGLDVPTRLVPLGEVLYHFLTEGAVDVDTQYRYGLRWYLLEVHSQAGWVPAVAITLAGIPGTASRPPGLGLLPFVATDFSDGIQLSNEVELLFEAQQRLDGGVAILLHPNQPVSVEIIQSLSDQDLSSVGQANLTMSLVNRSLNQEPFVLIRTEDGSRLDYHAISVRGGLQLDLQQRSDMFIELSLERARLVIKATSADAFIRSILPENGISTEFTLVVGLSQLSGFYFRGSGDLEIEIPDHQTLGAVELQSIILAVKPRPFTADIRIYTAANIKTDLGPLAAVIKGIGFQANITFAEDRTGTVALPGLQLGFKPPDSIGLSIDGGGFKGGGFLEYDETNHRYSGALTLEYQDRIELNAIGLITTQLPDGTPGYSLLIVITSEFTPVQLGLGFKLSGVGGLLGLNRTADVERLRTGLRDKTLDNVLFPENVIANADRILSDLTQVFPLQPDRFIFGPMARIEWGTPALITADLGLLIEIPDPIRVIILGVVKAILPDEQKRILQLQVNFLGVIDFQAQQFAFDASLYESKLLGYPLSGDMAVRMNWGADPNFLLSVGGFHPAYQPPPLNLPTLRRLSVQLISEDNLRLSLETYFAVTSNTVQFGAKAELYASAGWFNVYGFVSLDVLFQFSPFYFIASIQATLALRKGTSTIASVTFTFTLEGPTPWHVKGKASLTVGWFLTINIPFDKTWGDSLVTTLEDIPVLPLLKEALRQPGNWEAKIPDNHHLLVSFKQIQTTGNQVVVYPFGVLTIQQKVVPLKIDIQKFGNQRPADGNHFAIEEVWAGEGNDATKLDIDDVQESFAPAQFFELSEAEKLSRKSFEKYNSGIKVTDSETFTGDYAVCRAVDYELKYIDEQRNFQTSPNLFPPNFAAFDLWAVHGAIANSSLSFARNAKSALAPHEVTVQQEEYAVVNVNNLNLAGPDALAASEAGALDLVNKMIRDNPALAGELQVVPSFEVNRP